jgi:hypothetical protein
MNETLTVRRWYRVVPAGACVVLCSALVCVLWLCWPAAGAPGLLAFGVGFAAIIGLLVGHLLFCGRHRLEIDEERIISRRILAVTEIRLADITDVKWFADGLGGVVLQTNFDKVAINFARYQPDASLQIIQLLRDTLSKSIQQEWNRFCLRIGIPLRNPGSDTRRSEVLFSRAQFDRLLASLFFADLAFAVGYWWLVGFRGNWTVTALPLALTGLTWISIRYLVPVRSMAKVGWFPVAFFFDFLVDSLVWGSLFLGIVLLSAAFLFGLPQGFQIAVAVVVCAGVFEFVRRLIKGWTSYKKERELDLAHSAAAVREWELLDQGHEPGAEVTQEAASALTVNGT